MQKIKRSLRTLVSLSSENNTKKAKYLYVKILKLIKKELEKNA